MMYTGPGSLPSDQDIDCCKEFKSHDGMVFIKSSSNFFSGYAAQYERHIKGLIDYRIYKQPNIDANKLFSLVCDTLQPSHHDENIGRHNKSYLFYARPEDVEMRT